MSSRATEFRWLARSALGALTASILVIPLSAAVPASARSEAWHNDTFHVTRAGVFHAYFLMPKWFETDRFFIQIVGPKHVRHCTLRYGSRTDRARKVIVPYVDFWWPKKGLASATRATASCDVAGRRVTAATVFLPLGMRESRVTLRHT